MTNDPIENGPITTFLGEWEQTLLAQGRSPLTAKGYMDDVERYGGVSGAITSERARAIRESGLAPRTIARHLAAHAALGRQISPAMGVAAAQLFGNRPSMGVVVPGVVPTQEEMKRFIAAEIDPTFKGIWALMCGCGLRLAEVMTLCRNDFRAIDVRVVGKGSKMRDVPYAHISDIVLAIPAWRANTGPQRLFTMSSRTVQRRVKSNAVRAGLPDTWHPHALRHGFGTAVQEAQGDIRLTADLLGHSSLSTTMIYTHVRSERRYDAARAVLA